MSFTCIRRLPPAVTAPLAVIVLVAAAGCCARRSAPQEEPMALEKMNAPLRLALQGDGPETTLGEFIRVTVHLTRLGTDEDRRELERYALVGSVVGPVVTLTLRPKQLGPISHLPQVRAIELDARHLPTPSPPPPVR